jgi:hypothetical protein
MIEPIRIEVVDRDELRDDHLKFPDDHPLVLQEGRPSSWCEWGADVYRVTTNDDGTETWSYVCGDGEPEDNNIHRNFYPLIDIIDELNQRILKENNANA